MTVNDYLSEVGTDNLADELEARGFVVFNDTVHMAGELSDDELINEYAKRGLQHFNDAVDAIEYLESHGWHVSRENELEAVWHDIYGHALTMNHDSFMKWLNGRFIVHIERWL